MNRIQILPFLFKKAKDFVIFCVVELFLFNIAYIMLSDVQAFFFV